VNPLRRVLDASRPRVESADEFLGGDPNAPRAHVAQTAAAPLRTRTWVVATLALAAAAALAIAVWLLTQRPFEPAPTLDSDRLAAFATDRGLLCRTEVGLHYSCHAQAGPRTLEWYGASNRRATVLVAGGDPSWLGDVAAIAVPRSRSDEARRWVGEHAGGGTAGYGPVDLDLERAGAAGDTLTVDIH
jgi:hypothetical protein